MNVNGDEMWESMSNVEPNEAVFCQVLFAVDVYQF